MEPQDSLTPDMLHARCARPVTYFSIGVLLLLAGAVIGAFVMQYFSSGNSSTSYQAGFDAAKTLVENSSVGGMFKTPDDVRILSGTVSAISGNQLTLHTNVVNPFDDPALADRTVLMNASTTVVRLIQEVSAQQPTTKDTANESGPSVPIVSFATTTASASDIGVGDAVTVIASENVKTLKEFSAASIQILPKIAASQGVFAQ